MQEFSERRKRLGIPRKITFGEMRESGKRGLLVYCRDYSCNMLTLNTGFPSARYRLLTSDIPYAQEKLAARGYRNHGTTSCHLLSGPA